MKYINPRARVRDWQKILKRIDGKREKGYSIQVACTEEKIAASTYFQWRKRIESAKKMDVQEVRKRI